MRMKADAMMKDIALNSRKKYSLLADQDGMELFDRNERKGMQIKSKIPLNMIKFKNKSEKTRYVRIANGIIALNDTTLASSQNDIEYTYTKIFRFLADVLSPREFASLSYYHVSRFISNILKLSFDEGEEAQRSSSP